MRLCDYTMFQKELNFLSESLLSSKRMRVDWKLKVQIQNSKLYLKADELNSWSIIRNCAEGRVTEQFGCTNRSRDRDRDRARDSIL